MKKGKTALIVMQRAGKRALARALKECGALVRLARNCREARQALRSPAPVDVVFSDLSLDDGSWWTLREELAHTESRAALTVCLPRADGGATDLLESGCFAVLTPPYRKDAIRAIVDVAPLAR